MRVLPGVFSKRARAPRVTAHVARDGEAETTVATRDGSVLGPPLLHSIQHGTLAYTYKGVPTLKNPFDLALYPMLLWELRPRTIIEIGSFKGGSALWFSDTMRSFGLPVHIHCFDIAPVTDWCTTEITFHRADAEQLDRDISADFMRSLPRPLLVIEDAAHHKAMTLAVLNFFHQWLEPGEYIVVEDGIVTELGLAKSFTGGPQAAIAEFLAEHAEYEIDAKYCDWYGRNVTWAVNGFLRRRA